MTRRYLIDVLERVAATFVESFVGFLLMDHADVLTIDTLEKAAWSGLFAALVVVKSVAARFTGDKESAAMSRPRVRS